MFYIDSSGEVFKVESARELAEKMRQNEDEPPRDIEAWMAANALRAKEEGSARLRTDTVEHHIADMVGAGILQRIER